MFWIGMAGMSEAQQFQYTVFSFSRLVEPVFPKQGRYLEIDHIKVVLGILNATEVAMSQTKARTEICCVFRDFHIQSYEFQNYSICKVFVTNF